jgi:hypothetical protein
MPGARGAVRECSVLPRSGVPTGVIRGVGCALALTGWPSGGCDEAGGQQGGSDGEQDERHRDADSDPANRSRDYRLAAWQWCSRNGGPGSARAAAGGRPGTGRPRSGLVAGTGPAAGGPCSSSGHRPAEPRVRMVKWVSAGAQTGHSRFAGAAPRRWPCLVVMPSRRSWSLPSRGAGTAARVRVRASWSWRRIWPGSAGVAASRPRHPGVTPR